MMNWNDIPTLPDDEGDALEEIVERLATNGKIPADVTPQILFVLARRNHKAGMQNTNNIRKLWIAIGGIAAGAATLFVQHAALERSIEALKALVIAHLIGG